MNAMYSIIFGTLASVLPNLVFFWFLTLAKSRAPKTFINIFYISEGLKFAGLAAFLCICLLWPNLQVVNFFGGFLCAEIVRFAYIATQLIRTSK